MTQNDKKPELIVRNGHKLRLITVQDQQVFGCTADGCRERRATLEEFDRFECLPLRSRALGASQ